MGDGTELKKKNNGKHDLGASSSFLKGKQKEWKIQRIAKERLT